MQKTQTRVPILSRNSSTSTNAHTTSASPKSYIKKGDSLINSGHYQQALDQYKTALQMDQGNAQAWQKVAYCYFCLRNYEKSINYYCGALKLIANSKNYCYLGLSYINVLKYAQALQCFDYALKLDPNLEAATKYKQICVHQLSLQQSSDKQPVSSSPTATKIQHKVSQKSDGLQNSTMREQQVKIQKNATKNHTSKTQFDVQIGQLSELIRTNHYNIIAYLFRAYYFLRASMPTEFERDIQEAIWMAKKQKLSGGNQQLLNLMASYSVAYGQTINYLKGMMESPNLPAEKKQELRTQAGQLFLNMVKELKEEMQQGKCDLPRYQLYYQTLLTFNREMHQYLELQAKGESKIEKPKTMQDQLRNSIGNFVMAVKEYLNIESSVQFQKEQNRYFLTLSKLIYGIVKLFELVQDNIDIKSSNQPNRNITKDIISQIIKDLELGDVIGYLTSTLQEIFNSMFDLKYRGKQKIIRAKFCHLTQKYEDSDLLNSSIIRSVKILSDQPSKREQILATTNNQMIKDCLNIEIKLSRLADSLVSTVEETKDHILECLNSDKPDINKANLLACKDFTIFLNYVFRTQEPQLKSLQQIIISQLIDQAYIPKVIGLPVGLSVLMNASNRFCLFSSEQITLGLTETRVIIWEFLEVSSGTYNIRNLSSMRFVNWKDNDIYQADCCVENESNWNIKLVELGDRRGWLIRPSTNMKLCLSVETREKQRLKAWQTYFKPVVSEFKMPIDMKNLWYLTLRDSKQI